MGAVRYRFSEVSEKFDSRFLLAAATGLPRSCLGNDSGMALQALGIAQNGLGNGSPLVRDRGQSIKRTPDYRWLSATRSARELGFQPISDAIREEKSVRI
jgi:hypothetical protein